MYGADWCGDCRRAKAWFNEHDVDFTYVDLVDNPDETERVLERNNGLKKIPVIVFSDDSHLVEPSNGELAAKMAELDAALTAAPAVVENRELGRFELLHRGEVVSFATFREADGAVMVPHVETAPEHRGNGRAAELMDGLLAKLRVDGRTITPLCPFAAGHIADNPHHHDLLTASRA